MDIKHDSPNFGGRTLKDLKRGDVFGFAASTAGSVYILIVEARPGEFGAYVCLATGTRYASDRVEARVVLYPDACLHLGAPA